VDDSRGSRLRAPPTELPDFVVPELGDVAEEEPAPEQQPVAPAAAEAPSEHVQLAPTLARKPRRRFADDPGVQPAQEGANFHPADSRVAFSVVLRGAPRGLTLEDAQALGVAKTPGIELYSPALGEWDLVCRLEDLPPGKWVRLLDRSGAPVAFELCMLPEGLYVRWDGIAAPPPSGWWPPGSAPPGWGTAS
jgi:hypothetical protein